MFLTLFYLHNGHHRVFESLQQQSHAFWDKKEDWLLRGVIPWHIPAYSPELNLIEILWRKIKYEWLPISRPMKGGVMPYNMAQQPCNRTAQ